MFEFFLSLSLVVHLCIESFVDYLEISSHLSLGPVYGREVVRDCFISEDKLFLPVFLPVEHSFFVSMDQCVRAVQRQLESDSTLRLGALQDQYGALVPHLSLQVVYRLIKIS